MTLSQRIATIQVHVRLDPGAHVATSPDLPGLNVWGRDEAELCARIVAGIKALFRLDRQMDVDVQIAAEVNSFERPLALAPVSQFLIAQQH